MSQQPNHGEVRSRQEPFAERMGTAIWQEIPDPANPYLAAEARCYGYDLAELADKRSYLDVLYLLFRGELPTPAQTQLLQTLMIALINPGPRHPATRAAMNAGVGKTRVVHMLPIATSVLGGDAGGAGEVYQAMEFILSASAQPSAQLIAQASDTELNLAGFGVVYGAVDPMAARWATTLLAYESAGAYLRWGNGLAESLAAKNQGWLMTGVAAATLLDLGFSPRVGACLFQWFGAPGLMAHGLEFMGKPMLAMPFVSDENYVIER